MKGVKTAFISVALGLVMALGVFTMPLRATSAQSRLLVQAPNTIQQGSDIRVVVSVATGDAPVNAVQANVRYDSSMLNLTSVDTNSSAFTVEAQNQASDGEIRLARGTVTAVSGVQKVAELHFTARQAGGTTVSFNNGSAVVRSTDNGDDLNSTTTAIITIEAPVAASQVTSPTAVTLSQPTSNTSVLTPEQQQTVEQLQTVVRRLYAVLQAL